MTTCDRSFLEARCRERGYSLDEVMPCVVAQDGDQWTIDIESEFYPRTPRPGHEPPPILHQEPAVPAVRSHGPGAELKVILSTVGIASTDSCACNSRAALMDANGCDWCEQNMDEIVGWLRESAAERGLPFVDIVARVLVRRAIANARRKEAARVATKEAGRPPLHPES